MSKEFSETEARVAIHLQSPIDLFEYSAPDLYVDIEKIGFEPPLSYSDNQSLLHSLRGLELEPSGIQMLNPMYLLRQRKLMSLTLARYALTIGDVFTSYNAARYAETSPGAYATPASLLLRQIVDIPRQELARVQYISDIL